MQLVIGNKNYSTWSLRPWLLLRKFLVPFDEIQESLRAEALGSRLARYSPTRRVPVLIDGDLVVWDSLAICEYVSERYLDGTGWPAGVADRARARSVSAEMHAGFTALRAELPMNLRARRRVTPSANAKRDIARIEEIWASAKGPWLFGEFSIADAMYAPVALRFPTYGIEPAGAAGEYMERIRRDPAVGAWIEAGLQETEVVDEDEAGEEIAQ